MMTRGCRYLLLMAGLLCAGFFLIGCATECNYRDLDKRMQKTEQTAQKAMEEAGKDKGSYAAAAAKCEECAQDCEADADRAERAAVRAENAAQSARNAADRAEKAAARTEEMYQRMMAK